MRTVEMLELLTKRAKEYVKDEVSVARNSHMNELEPDVRIDRKVLEAVVVDFINFVGRKNGVDYALYAKDLHEEDPNQSSEGRRQGL